MITFKSCRAKNALYPLLLAQHSFKNVSLEMYRVHLYAPQGLMQVLTVGKSKLQALCRRSKTEA